MPISPAMTAQLTAMPAVRRNVDAPVGHVAGLLLLVGLETAQDAAVSVVWLAVTGGVRGSFLAVVGEGFA